MSSSLPKLRYSYTCSIAQFATQFPPLMQFPAGGMGHKGKVAELGDWSDASLRSGVYVVWEGGRKNLYRLGFEGRVRYSIIGTVWCIDEMTVVLRTATPGPVMDLLGWDGLAMHIKANSDFPDQL